MYFVIVAYQSGALVLFSLKQPSSIDNKSTLLFNQAKEEIQVLTKKSTNVEKLRSSLTLERAVHVKKMSQLTGNNGHYI